MGTFTNIVLAAAAVANVVIAVTAVWATLRAPRNAALIAENIRKQTEQELREKNVKLFNFYTLMQHRAMPYADAAVQQLNMVDVIYHDQKEIRDAWHSYFSSLDRNNNIEQGEQRRRLSRLLIEIALHLGFSTTISENDIERVYTPEFIMRKMNIESIRDRLSEQELIALFADASANTTPQPG